MAALIIPKLQSSVHHGQLSRDRNTTNTWCKDLEATTGKARVQLTQHTGREVKIMPQRGTPTPTTLLTPQDKVGRVWSGCGEIAALKCGWDVQGSATAARGS